MLLHLLILGLILSLSATVLVLMCCAVGARAEAPEDEMHPLAADVEGVVGEVPLPAPPRSSRATLG